MSFIVSFKGNFLIFQFIDVNLVRRDNFPGFILEIEEKDFFSIGVKKTETNFFIFLQIKFPLIQQILLINPNIKIRVVLDH